MPMPAAPEFDEISFDKGDAPYADGGGYIEKLNTLAERQVTTVEYVTESVAELTEAVDEQVGIAAAHADSAEDDAAAAEAAAGVAAAQAAAALASAAAAAALAGAITGTSITSLLIGTGAKVFVTQAGEQYVPGIFMIAASQANPANFMAGQVTAYSGTSLTINVTVVGGSGTYADWNLSLAGVQGPQGAQGPAYTGGNLTTGMNMARGTVAMHATTMNLWAQPNTIDGTGSAVTITAIANAPQAGARRTLYPIAGTIITNGATFAVDGAANATAATGDAWEFEAVTTSTYKVHITKKSGAAVIGESVVRSARTSNTILGAGDIGTFIDITDGAFSQTFTAAATLGSGWFVYIRNSGTNDITLDPNGAELIDGLATYIMYPGECRLVQCTGSAFTSILITGFTKIFTSTGSFVRPPGYSTFFAELWGAGGGGGSGGKWNASQGGGGGGGGGGAYLPVYLQGSAISATETITIGAGGTGGAAQATNSTNGNTGGTGGTTTFGTRAGAFGGTGGGGGTAQNQPTVGGNGGGMLPSTQPVDGAANSHRGMGGGPGGNSGNIYTGQQSVYGGGGGGGRVTNNDAGNLGGISRFGGGGGGGGAVGGSSPTNEAGSGGGFMINSTEGAGGAGGMGTAGAPGVNFRWGGGGGSSTNSVAFAGGAGGVAGGGGGGGSGVNSSFNSAVGGAGGGGYAIVRGLV